MLQYRALAATAGQKDVSDTSQVVAGEALLGLIARFAAATPARKVRIFPSAPWLAVHAVARNERQPPVGRRRGQGGTRGDSAYC
jgi:hypothetical protein